MSVVHRGLLHVKNDGAEYWGCVEGFETCYWWFGGVGSWVLVEVSLACMGNGWGRNNGVRK